jgi:hypothetical protein
MPGPFDPFTPGEDNTPFAGIDPRAFEQIKANIGSFMGNPGGQAALLSAGLALMQPPSFGDNAASQIGRALGTAGETVGRRETMDLKEREQESKAELRGSQALAAESRAAAAEARAGTAGARLGNQAERLAFQERSLEAKNERNMLGAKIRLANQYQNYVKDVAKRNENAKLLGSPPEPVESFPDWVNKNPMLKNLGLLPQATPTDPDDGTPVPPAASTTSQPPAAAAGVPAVGEIRKGHRFKGGNPADRANWEKI